MPEMHLREPRFTYSAYQPFARNTERIQKFKETRDIFIKTNQIKLNSKHDGYQRGLPSNVYKFFDRKTSSLWANKSAGGAVKNENMSNQELAEELHKFIIRKFEKREVQILSIDHIQVVNLAI